MTTTVRHDYSRLDSQIEQTGELLAKYHASENLDPDFLQSLWTAVEGGFDYELVECVPAVGAPGFVLYSKLPKRFVELLSTLGTLEC